MRNTRKNMTRKYLLGICYTCQKCLFCFNSKSYECECNKNIKPKRKQGKPEPGQQIYSCKFTPNQDFPTANQFLFAANTKFQYNSNFDNTFPFTFCSTCNSSHQRFKKKDKKTRKKHKHKSIKMNDNLIEVDDSTSPEDSEVEEYDLEEIKLQIIVEKMGKKTSTSKTITVKPVEYINVIEKVNAVVQRALQNKDINPADYSMSYKAVNARGPSNELEDKLDFHEFIEDYKKVIAAKKKMSVIVVIGDSVGKKTKEKRSKVKNYLYFNYFFIFYIYN